ncbi:hypothetical protein R8Z50_29440 [Longispora sp. K20-0274]|uniref:hypothetical protein n=1 Tax=Longispora sp. K20-0274 TaxID=3088255 RepID=UPI00399AD2BA
MIDVEDKLRAGLAAEVDGLEPRLSLDAVRDVAAGRRNRRVVVVAFVLVLAGIGVGAGAAVMPAGRAGVALPGRPSSAATPVTTGPMADYPRIGQRVPTRQLLPDGTDLVVWLARDPGNGLVLVEGHRDLVTGDIRAATAFGASGQVPADDFCLTWTPGGVSGSTVIMGFGRGDVARIRMERDFEVWNLEFDRVLGESDLVVFWGTVPAGVESDRSTVTTFYDTHGGIIKRVAKS